jgi:hypothetical protein
LMLKVERLEATMRYLERHRRKIQAAA